ncbi:Vitamin B6 photo-protection and homoeostasis [Fragilaria crotonensis]|nr:Vitamin B6 photo-protection and homoeostasis [Fragilaria crotonensis]
MTTLMIRTSLLLLWISNATCLAQTPHFSKLISTKKGTGLSKTYRILPEDITPGGILPSSSIQDKTKSNDGLISQVSAGIRSTFLPSGYPKSTPPGYLQYSIWSWIQDLSSQLRSVLATQRVLEGVGVGRQGATALSALLNFLVRDGCGMGANLLFTSLASSSFSTDGKRWRIFADIMVDIGLTLEVCATMVPGNWFLPMICAGNMCKAICGVAAGAVGGVFNLHWAQGSDIADIQAKFGAQHTVTGSLGLLCAYQFVQTVAQVDPTHLWALYGALTILHLYANMRCMKIIAFDYLNTPRMRMVIQQFLEQWNNGQAETLTILNPKDWLARSHSSSASHLDENLPRVVYYSVNPLRDTGNYRTAISEQLTNYWDHSQNQYATRNI